ncbi:MAG: hypothetical protein WC130_05035 [Kiritimatiellia bacterium]
MQISLELVALLVTVFGGALTFVYGYGAFTARLEAMKETLKAQETACQASLFNYAQRINIIEKRHYDLDNCVAKELSEVRESLARIEGALSAK